MDMGPHDFDGLRDGPRQGDGAAALVFARYAHRLAGPARKHPDARLRRKADPEDVVQTLVQEQFDEAPPARG
jgi:hypothetical protein